MLVLSRKEGERIRIGDDVQLVVLRSSSGGVKLGIEAPRQVRILRSELQPAFSDDPEMSDHAVERLAG